MIRTGHTLFLALAASATVALAQDTPDPQRTAARTARLPGELVADFDNGSTIYDHACGACHGETGEGVPGSGPALRNTVLSLDEILRVVNRGSSTMPAFAVLSNQQLVDVSTFVKERL